MEPLTIGEADTCVWPGCANPVEVIYVWRCDCGAHTQVVCSCELHYSRNTIGDDNTTCTACTTVTNRFCGTETLGRTVYLND